MKRLVTRSAGLIAIVATCALHAPLVSAQITLPRENIVVILADDFGVDMLSCYGEGTDPPNTPNICNRLASQGVLFRNAWANPTCSPTRATIHTGRYAFRNGVFAPGVPLPFGEITLPDIFDEPANQLLGYSTAQIGKWHLSGGNFGCTASSTPADHGWDHYAGAPSNINNYFNWCRWEDGTQDQCVVGGTVPECATESYATIVNVNDAIDWVGQQNGPFLLWLAFNAPHSPFQAPPQDCPGGPCHGVALPVAPGENCPTSNQRPCYEAMVETMDTEIGRFLDALPSRTTVIFIGDNGSPRQVVIPPFIPNRAKFTIYEGGVNVPLIVSSPSIATSGRGGTESAALVNASDLFATILDIAGAEAPSGLLEDSESLVPVLSGTAGKGLRGYVFSERFPSTATTYDKVARDRRYKLIRRPNASPENIEFYDLEGDLTTPGDPFEAIDLYDDAAPNLTADQQAAFDDINEYFAWLDGSLPACPVKRSCSNPGGTCGPAQLPPTCPVTSFGSGGCIRSDGALFQCPPGTTIRVRNCPCRALIPGSICVNEDQSWFCN